MLVSFTLIATPFNERGWLKPNEVKQLARVTAGFKFSIFRKVTQCMYHILYNTSSELWAVPHIKCIMMSAASHMNKHGEWHNEDYYSLTFPQIRFCCQMGYKLFSRFQSFLDFGFAGERFQTLNTKPFGQSVAQSSCHGAWHYWPSLLPISDTTEPLTALPLSLPHEGDKPHLLSCPWEGGTCRVPLTSLCGHHRSPAGSWAFEQQAWRDLEILSAPRGPVRSASWHWRRS